MGNSYNFNAVLVAGALALSAALPLRATTIFDNSSNDLSTRFNPGTTQVGDEILLDSTERYLTSFSFEFWGISTANPNSFSGHVQAQVHFYLNDGPPFNGYETPYVPFYTSALFDVPTTPLTGRNTMNFTVADFPGDQPLFIPTSDMTWSIQFTGMEAGDSVGLDIYSPPTIGHDYPDYWANDGGGWMLMTNSVPMDFAAQFNAIPEPSVLTLSVVGGLGILGFAYRLRRRE